MMTGSRLFILAVIVVGMSAVYAVKEWKNFENGKVYSHKIASNKKQEKENEAGQAPVHEERLLHSHHRDKKAHHQLKTTRLQSTEGEFRSRNNERHHKKNIEEEMHLKPLNERHHKFPNPALLNDADPQSVNPKITKQNLVKEAKKRGRLNNRRMYRGRRYKRNKGDQNALLRAHGKTTTSTYLLKNDNNIEKSTAYDVDDKPVENKNTNQDLQAKSAGAQPRVVSYW